MVERLVVTVASKPKRKNPGSRVRFTVGGITYTYLNATVPDCGPITDSICDVCGRYGYSENIINGTSVCSECRIERIMELAEALEAQGVPMGAGIHEVWRRLEAGGWESVGYAGHDKAQEREAHPGARVIRANLK